ncbi:MAG: LPS export ABC transporter permease LptF, partial [Alphaproteobacteria bacterium]|nr:LPS export ABC transporter permease LptF [Alphaproteobacteria bacterium]
MRSTTRYVLQQLIVPFVLVSAVLTGVIWLSQSLRFIDMIINMGVPPWTFFTLTLLLLPTALAYILPLAVLCAILFSYNRLVGDSELVVLRAVGLGPWRLAAPGLLLAGLATGIMFVISLYLMPAGFRAFKSEQFMLRHDLAAIPLREGVFNSLGNNLTVYVRMRDADGALRGILVHDSREPARPVTMMAESGLLVRTDQGPRFILGNGNRQEVQADRKQLSMLYFERYSLDLTRYIDAAGDRWLEPGERFLPELFWPDDSLDDRRNRDELIAEGHWRLVMPLYPLGFALIALAAMLGGPFNRREQWRRVWLMAVPAALTLELTGLALRAVTAETPEAIPLLYGHIAAACAGASVALG